MQSKKPLAAAAIASVCVGLASPIGCGSKSPYDTVPAKGKITFSDGSRIPAARIDLQFISQEPALDAKTHPRPGVALVDPADGTFVVSTYGFADGLIRGHHKATVAAYDDNRQPLKSVHPKYRSVETTPLEFDAEQGTFDILLDKM